jgi:hypothetical protein
MKGLLESLGWVVDVGVIFGLHPKITPTFLQPFNHRVRQARDQAPRPMIK